MGLPLGGDIRDRIFKVIFLDSGLVCAALGLTLQRVTDLAGLVLVNEGGLAEQSVGQVLRAALPHFSERALHFWSSERKGAEAEVDYLVQHGSRIVPIGVEQQRVRWPGTRASTVPGMPASDWDALTAEMRRFEYAISPSGGITYDAPSGYHDDCVMALALANHRRWETESCGRMLRVEGGSRRGGAMARRRARVLAG